MNTLSWPCCCCKSNICITTNGLCPLGTPLAGSVVVLKKPDGSTFGTKTTDGTGKVCFDVGATKGTFTYTATWTNGKVQTGSVNVTTCRDYTAGATFVNKSCVTVTGCDGVIDDATVTICGHSATFDSGLGQYCFSWAADIPPETPCNVVVTLATGPTQTKSFTPGCGITFTFIDRICVTVTRCVGGLPGASVQVKNGATVLYANTTGDDGKVCFEPSTDLTGVTLTIIASKPPRYADKTVNAVADCQMGIHLDPSAGYFCCGCPDPLKEVLQVTDANGTHATRTGAPNGAGLCTWNVCYQTPAVANAYANDFTGCHGTNASTPMSYQIQYNGVSWAVVAQWGENTCPAGDIHYGTISVGCLGSGQIGVGLGAGAAVDSAVGPLTGDCSVPTVLSGTVPSPGTHLPSPVLGLITVTE